MTSWRFGYLEITLDLDEGEIPVAVEYECEDCGGGEVELGRVRVSREGADGDLWPELSPATREWLLEKVWDDVRQGL